MKRDFKYIITKEGKYYVSRCLNVEVSSFGETIDEALFNLKEALQLYYEDKKVEEYLLVDDALIGEMNILINA